MNKFKYIMGHYRVFEDDAIEGAVTWAEGNARPIFRDPSP